MQFKTEQMGLTQHASEKKSCSKEVNFVKMKGSDDWLFQNLIMMIIRKLFFNYTEM